MTSSLAPLLGVMFIIGMAPLIAVICTAFTKIVVLLLIARNAIGIQQTPPNIIIFSLAMVLSYSVMSEVVERSLASIPPDAFVETAPAQLGRVAEKAAEPFRQFMLTNSNARSREMFQSIARKRNAQASDDQTRYAVLIPAFVMDELTKAFRLGFIVYIPFLIIDLVASCILIAIGMQMVSVTNITTPLKILLFVEAQGWERLMEFLLLSYR